MHSQQQHYAPELKVSVGSQTSPVVFCKQNSVISIQNDACHYWLQPSSVAFRHCKTVDFSIRPTRLYGCQPSFVGLCMQNCVTLASRITIVYLGPRPHLWFFAFKTVTLARELQVSMVPSTSSVVLCIHNSDIMNQNCIVSMRPSPHLLFCEFTTTTLCPELSVSMGPRPPLSFCACKTAWLALELLVSMGPRPHLSFCACKTSWLASELLVSMGPSPHLWFLHAKQRLLDQNYNSLWVPDLT